MKTLFLNFLLLVFTANAHAVENIYEFHYQLYSPNQLDSVIAHADQLLPPTQWQHMKSVFLLIEIRKISGEEPNTITFNITNNNSKFSGLNVNNYTTSILRKNEPTYFLIKLGKFFEWKRTPQELEELKFTFTIVK